VKVTFDIEYWQDAKTTGRGFRAPLETLGSLIKVSLHKRRRRVCVKFHRRRPRVRGRQLSRSGACTSKANHKRGLKGGGATGKGNLGRLQQTRTSHAVRGVNAAHNSPRREMGKQAIRHASLCTPVAQGIPWEKGICRVKNAKRSLQERGKETKELGKSENLNWEGEKKNHKDSQTEILTRAQLQAPVC